MREAQAFNREDQNILDFAESNAASRDAHESSSLRALSSGSR